MPFVSRVTGVAACGGSRAARPTRRTSRRGPARRRRTRRDRASRAEVATARAADSAAHGKNRSGSMPRHAARRRHVSVASLSSTWSVRSPPVLVRQELGALLAARVSGSSPGGSTRRCHGDRRAVPSPAGRRAERARMISSMCAMSASFSAREERGAGTQAGRSTPSVAELALRVPTTPATASSSSARRPCTASRSPRPAPLLGRAAQARPRLRRGRASPTRHLEVGADFDDRGELSAGPAPPRPRPHAGVHAGVALGRGLRQCGRGVLPGGDRLGESRSARARRRRGRHPCVRSRLGRLRAGWPRPAVVGVRLRASRTPRSASAVATATSCAASARQLRGIAARVRVRRLLRGSQGPLRAPGGTADGVAWVDGRCSQRRPLDLALVEHGDRRVRGRVRHAVGQARSWTTQGCRCGRVGQ